MRHKSHHCCQLISTSTLPFCLIEEKVKSAGYRPILLNCNSETEKVNNSRQRLVRHRNSQSHNKDRTWRLCLSYIFTLFRSAVRSSSGAFLLYLDVLEFVLHTVAIGAAVAVYAAVCATAVYIHSVLSGEYSFGIDKMHKLHRFLI